jgi:DNA-binding winged helix-turn-helix (wHTH) protein
MIEFPPFRLDTVNLCLWRRKDRADEVRILLTPKTFGVLRYLVDHRGRLVTHEEILEAVWPDTHVQPEILKRHIFEIRNVLGDDSKRPSFIETLPRRGYQFIAAVRQGTASEPNPADPAERTKLVGRDLALAELGGCLAEACKGRRQIIFVTGESGIGKTALTDEFQRQAIQQRAGAGALIRVAHGQCVEGYGGREPYYPMLGALGDLCRRPGGDFVVQILAAQAPTWLVQFPSLIKREQRDMLQREILGATRIRMLREIGDALAIITADDPMLLVLEDLHWADHSTVDLISAIARGRGPAKLLLVATYRPGDMAFSEHPLRLVKQDLLVHQLCQELPLEPLGKTDVAAYLSGDSPDSPAPADLTELLHRHSEGNPLFMVAALEHMTQRGFISRESRTWKLNVPLERIDLEVPESLRQMIEIQIERLTNEERRVLEVASITGAVFATEVGSTPLNMDAESFGDLCNELARRQQIVRASDCQVFPNGTFSECYGFVHTLYREVFYRRQAPGSRAKLNRSIGERLETLYSENASEIAGQLAQHFEEGLDWPRAVKYLRLAAETAAARYAPRQATAILERAYEVTQKLPEAERALSETEILEKLASMYVVSFDMRVLDTYETLRARASYYGMIDLEVRALIGMAYPLSWTSSQACLEVLDRALKLGAEQEGPISRARTRASCLVRRLWAGGWNPGEAEQIRDALSLIAQSGDRSVLASHRIDCAFIQWCSSEYREARRSAVDSLSILVEDEGENPYQSFAHWLSQFILPWSLLFLGEWGQALSEIEDGITIANKNGDGYRTQTTLLYRAWVYLHAMNFAGVITICDSVLPMFQDLARSPWRRFGLILAGSAEAALGNYEPASTHLSMAKTEMDRQTVIMDWYWRMLLESGLTELSIMKMDLAQARPQAERFRDVALETPERTWQALAWEANARVAVAELDLTRAQDCIAHALFAMEGFDAPLAFWRVHATAYDLYQNSGDRELAQRHQALSRGGIMRLANSLTATDPLRQIFLSSPMVRKILGGKAGSRLRRATSR